nr:MAG TPA: Tle cognate immunity protein 4 C-terminal domain [Caudoviricetes sp.]
MASFVDIVRVAKPITPPGFCLQNGPFVIK